MHETPQTTCGCECDPCGAASLGAASLKAAAECLEAALRTEAGATDQFMSDIHGDALAFDHLVRSGSGEVRSLVGRACERALAPAELDALCAMLYYPEAPAARACAEAAGVDVAVLAARVRSHTTGRFHLVGDLWDRGAHGDDCADVLMACPDADVQWGNHDVCWMGAAAGDPACIATCLRNNIKYSNIEQFQVGYDIDLEPLFAYARKAYAPDDVLSPEMKAVSALLFKCEGQAIGRHPEWGMGQRLLWGAMDVGRGSVPVYGVMEQLKTRDFPTWGAGDPYALDAGEKRIMDGLVEAFTSSVRLQAQVQWLYDHGSVYAVAGDALLFHGCVPLTDDGALAPAPCGDERLSGRALLDGIDALCRRAWEQRDRETLDWMGYLWGGWQATFAGRVVKTFERTYIADEATWKEPQDPYFALTKDDPTPCALILGEFGVDPDRGFIVNGHTPVKLPKGERPVRGAGKRIVIDGGLCKAYRKTTGIAGYTLVRDADGGLRLVAHGEFCGLPEAVAGTADVAHEVARIR